jgi:carbon storage regulator
MLVLSRREAQRIRLGDSIVVTVLRVAGDKVRLGIDAPRDVLVLRDELEEIDTKDAKSSDAMAPQADSPRALTGGTEAPLAEPHAAKLRGCARCECTIEAVSKAETASSVAQFTGSQNAESLPSSGPTGIETAAIEVEVDIVDVGDLREIDLAGLGVTEIQNAGIQDGGIRASELPGIEMSTN